MSTTHYLPAFPSHGTMGEVAQPGMSMRLLVAAHAMQGLVAGAVARNGAQSLVDEDDQIALVAMANDLGRHLITCVEAVREQEANDWRHRREGELETALRELHEACTSANAGLEDDPVNREKYREAMRQAVMVLDDGIPF